MVQKTLDLNVFPNLASLTIVFYSFDLWMFQGVVEIFALVINFLNESWSLIDVYVGLFEVDETNGKNMVVQFESLFSHFGLMHRVIAFVKNEGNNLNTMAIALRSIIIYQPNL